MLIGRAPLEVTFTDTSTPSDITYWHWDFGDGDTSEEQNPVHLYTDVGEYTVTLNIASGKGIDTYSDTVLVTGLVAHWRLDEGSGTRADVEGGYDVDEVGGAIASVAGPAGDAVSFVAAEGKYLYSASPVPLNAAGGMTIACWLRIPAGGPANAIWFLDGSIFTDNLSLGTANAGATYCFIGVRDSVGTTQTAGFDLAAFDTWFFVCGKYDPATKKCSFSIDAGAWTLTGNAALASDPNITLGYRAIGFPAPSCPTAYVDDLRVYNTVLTDAEVDALYALGSP